MQFEPPLHVSVAAARGAAASSAAAKGRQLRWLTAEELLSVGLQWRVAAQRRVQVPGEADAHRAGGHPTRRRHVVELAEGTHRADVAVAGCADRSRASLHAKRAEASVIAVAAVGTNGWRCGSGQQARQGRLACCAAVCAMHHINYRTKCTRKLDEGMHTVRLAAPTDVELNCTDVGSAEVTASCSAVTTFMAVTCTTSTITRSQLRACPC